jgi:flagellar biosynthesis/type III secretory pathway protein FliH
MKERERKEGIKKEKKEGENEGEREGGREGGKEGGKEGGGLIFVMCRFLVNFFLI